ncbi:hypothetical protein P9139_04945 [Curtobacterium flaccumfaciens]|nr:hypothetical protein P9139_04945 [Curtobacterium flaccumfaciens]
MIAIIVVGAVLLVSVVLIVFEGRVMAKPEADRTDRERRFLTADRAAARGYQTYARSVAPWIAVGAAVVGLVITIPFWLDGRTGVAAGLTVLFVVLGGGMLVFWATVLRHRGPGSAWRERQDERTREADAAGRPRWFVNVRAGWWLAGGFTVLGAAALIGALYGVGSPFTGGIMLAVGVLYLVLVAVQQRAEHRR